MEIICSVEELRRVLRQQRGTIGFVPTMGALHNGHLSLIKRSSNENDITIVSIFVNPKQFLEGEDFNKYPRKLEADINICKRGGVDILFTPKIEDIYFKDEPYICAPKISGYIIEGLDRPGHFSGMLNIVLKLFNITKPTRAYFGKKDAQQLFLIQKMVSSLFLDIEIVPCEIVRESDGLALSSRNVYLSKDGREQALLISKSIKRGGILISQGEKNPSKIKDEMLKILEPLIVDYVEIVDRDFRSVDEIKTGETILLVVARVEGVRLLDNLFA